MTDNFDSYRAFISKVDELSSALAKQHNQHMLCKKGCDLCCMNYRIFPVEYYAMQKALEDKPVVTSESVDGSCVFLHEHACQIYEARPTICRTHGLPLLYMNDDQWELSACELNFTEFDDEDFSAENTFPQDRFNSELFQINKQFIADNKLPYSEFDLLDIKDLAKSTKK